MRTEGLVRIIPKFESWTVVSDRAGRGGTVLRIKSRALVNA